MLLKNLFVMWLRFFRHRREGHDVVVARSEANPSRNKEAADSQADWFPETLVYRLWGTFFRGSWKHKKRPGAGLKASSLPCSEGLLMWFLGSRKNRAPQMI